VEDFEARSPILACRVSDKMTINAVIVVKESARGADSVSISGVQINGGTRAYQVLSAI
jgi:hypothetical protein